MVRYPSSPSLTAPSLPHSRPHHSFILTPVHRTSHTPRPAPAPPPPATAAAQALESERAGLEQSRKQLDLERLRLRELRKAPTHTPALGAAAPGGLLPAAGAGVAMLQGGVNAQGV